MDNTQKMFKSIINGQSAMKQELLGKIEKLSDNLEDFKQEVRNEFRKVNKRIDTIGLQLAYLEDDASTGGGI